MKKILLLWTVFFAVGIVSAHAGESCCMGPKSDKKSSGVCKMNFSPKNKQAKSQ